MEKRIYFDSVRANEWPSTNQLSRFFLAPKGQEWSYSGGNDSWGLTVDGLYGTEAKDRLNRVRAHLSMTGHPNLGVYLSYGKWDGRIQHKTSRVSKGDLGRLGDFVHSLQGDVLSIGLFIPFAVAWRAVKEFMETDGELPESIEWIAVKDLPTETFPVPPRPSSG